MTRHKGNKGTKVKYVEPKWQYVRYATKLHGWFAGVTCKGSKFYRIIWWNGTSYGLSVTKLPLEEARHFETLGPADEGIQKMARFKGKVPWTKAASSLFTEAEAYVKKGGR